MFIKSGLSLAYLCGVPLRVSSSLTYKHYTRLERLAVGKHPSLLQTLKIPVLKSFITLVPDGILAVDVVPQSEHFRRVLQVDLLGRVGRRHRLLVPEADLRLEEVPTINGAATFSIMTLSLM